jgi:DNA-binding transcriptional MerR regulator
VTIEEVFKQYHIPEKILKEYESMGLCKAVREVMGDWKYDDEDLERLSMIMTLHDIGFTTEEVENYMKLLIAGESTEHERMIILNKKRSETLDDIHFREKQLDKMDYLRYEMRRNRA